MSDWEALSDKLKALGVELGKEKRFGDAPAVQHPIEKVVDGQFWDSIYGPAFFYQEVYPPDYCHGATPLWPASTLATICQWASAHRLSRDDIGDIIFLDTETSGLAGGTGTYAFEVGLGRFSDQGFCLAQFFMRHPGEEPALLAALSEFMTDMKAVVTYNGKSFDIPLLNTRYTLMGMTSPFDAVDHFDLLPLARRLWCLRLESRTLGNVENQILGVTRGDEEVPGYMIPDLYFDYLKTGDARPLAGIFYHNAIDILSLAGLFSHMTAILQDPFTEKTPHNQDIVALARLFESMEDHQQAANLYRKALNTHLPDELYWDTIKRFSFLLKRNQDWQGAIDLWRKAADHQDLYAFVELAKYYEHQTKDLVEAQQWTLKGIKALKAHHTPVYQYNLWKEDLDHRLKRLNRRIAGLASG